MLFDRKEVVFSGKLRVGGQRHQPHNDIREHWHKIEASIRNLIKLHHGLNALDFHMKSKTRECLKVFLAWMPNVAS
jgi:hypothetical protein